MSNQLKCIICDEVVHNSNTETKKHLRGFVHKQYRTFIEKHLAGVTPEVSVLERAADHRNHECKFCDKKWLGVDHRQTKNTPQAHLTNSKAHTTKVVGLWNSVRRRLSARSAAANALPRDDNIFCDGSTPWPSNGDDESA